MYITQLLRPHDVTLQSRSATASPIFSVTGRYASSAAQYVAVARSPHLLRCASSAAPRVSGRSPHLLRAPCSRPIVRHRLGAHRSARAYNEAHNHAPPFAATGNRGRGGFKTLLSLRTTIELITYLHSVHDLWRVITRGAVRRACSRFRAEGG